MFKKWNLNNLIYHEITAFDYSMKYTDDEGTNVTLYDTTTFLHKVAYKYASWCISSPGFYDTEDHTWINMTETIDDAINVLHSIYADWRTEKLPAFRKLYEAMRAEYNPIWNVDGVTGLITEDSHTGTDTLRKTGTDTSNTSGQDRTSASGSDVTTLSGKDTTALSGADALSQTGTVKDDHTGNSSDAHTGTIGNTKKITQDVTTYAGKEINSKAGMESHDEAVFTFDNQSTPMKSNTSTDSFPPLNDANARADIKSFDERSDSHLYTDIDTQTFNDTETTTNNLHDTTTFNKTDTTSYGKTDTTTYGKTDTLTHGKVDTTQYGKQDKLTHDTTDTSTKDLQDKHIELQIRQGNIGVTTTQKMLNEQIDLTARDALVDYMISDFIHTCCIL